MDEKTLQVRNWKLRQVSNLISYFERFRKCPLTGSELEKTCDTCVLCAKFHNYIKEELNVEFRDGRFYYVENKSGRWVRTEEFKKKNAARISQAASSTKLNSLKEKDIV